MDVYGELRHAQAECRSSDAPIATATKGRLWFRTDISFLRVNLGASADTLAMLASSQIFAGNNTYNGTSLFGGIPTFSTPATMAQVSTPANPASLFNKIYPKSDDNFYILNSAGTESKLLTTLNSFVVPTVQRFTVTGSTAGYMFTVTSANATAGATYTNNGNTYTVLGTISSGTTLFCSQASAPSGSGTLTKASGTGDATITFASSVAGGIYTTPANVLYLRVKLQGGGGGGAGSTSNSGADGNDSWFAATAFVKASHGVGASPNAGAGGIGGTVTISGATATIFSQTGGMGSGGQNVGSLTENVLAGVGGNSFFGGAGVSTSGNAGSAAAANSGAGGGGGSQGSANTGGGGGAGGYSEVFISSPQAKYFYIVGTGGAGGSAGGQAGGNGAAGQLVVEEYYQ